MQEGGGLEVRMTATCELDGSVRKQSFGMEMLKEGPFSGFHIHREGGEGLDLARACSSGVISITVLFERRCCLTEYL